MSNIEDLRMSIDSMSVKDRMNLWKSRVNKNTPATKIVKPSKLIIPEKARTEIMEVKESMEIKETLSNKSIPDTILKPDESATSQKTRVPDPDDIELFNKIWTDIATNTMTEVKPVPQSIGSEELEYIQSLWRTIGELPDAKPIVETDRKHWREVRLFVSSTFTDYFAEREILVKQVIPQLREWCEARRLTLIDIDLR
jgi:hypothetical protein